MSGYLGNVILKIIDETEEYSVPDQSEKKLVFYSDLDSDFAEQNRVLSSKIVQLNKKKKIKIIAITSSVKGEGKTLTACNLAYTLATSFSKRVCLLELDLKDPKINKYWGQKDKGVGIDEILYDYKLLAESVVKMFQGNLVMIPCGVGVPNHTSLLSSDRLESFVNALSDAFDFLIIDTPPVMPLTDAQLIKNIIDGIIYVVRGGDTPKELVVRGLESVSEKLVGVVLNGVDSFGYYAMRYKYSYTYPQKR